MTSSTIPSLLCDGLIELNSLLEYCNLSKAKYVVLDDKDFMRVDYEFKVDIRILHLKIGGKDAPHPDAILISGTWVVSNSMMNDIIKREITAP
jgi:hypothetical protein